MHRPRNRSPRLSDHGSSPLTFSPLAWLKLLYFCHAGPTEVGGFGISSPDNLLRVDDFVTVPQQATPVSVRFGDAGIAQHFDHHVDQGLTPECFARIWCHTHPGASATPSLVDEATFGRCFGGCDWALMFILARGGETYARLQFNAGPGGHLLVPVAVDWSTWPAWLAEHDGSVAVLASQWRREYAENVNDLPATLACPCPPGREPEERLLPWWPDHPWCHDLDEIHYQPMEVQAPDERSTPAPSF